MKVLLVLKLSSLLRSLSLGRSLVCAIVLGLGLTSAVSLAQGQLTVPGNDDDSAEEEEEQEKLIGLLDPTLANPLMTLAEEKEFKEKRSRAYTTSALKSPSPDNKARNLIDEGVRYRVRRMTIPDNWTEMSRLTSDLIKDLEIFASSARAREHALSSAVRELDALLFAKQPTLVKINAALLLGSLNIKNADRIAKVPALPYLPAADPLIKVVADPNMRMDVKIPAVRGLTRIMADGNPPGEVRDKISKAMADEMGNIQKFVAGPGRDWYHWTLIDALGSVERPRSMTQQTFVVDALWKAMHDESLPWHLRTRAIRSLGQIKLDSTFNLPLLAYEIVLFTGKMTATYNSRPDLSFWPLCFYDLYFTFNAQEASQRARGWGLLEDPPTGARQVVEGAYQQVLPLVNAVIKHETPQRVPGTLLGPTSEWLKSNKPADVKIHQNAQPLMAVEPEPEAPADETAAPSAPGNQGTSSAQSATQTAGAGP